MSSDLFGTCAAAESEPQITSNTTVIGAPGRLSCSFVTREDPILS
jgi:hypothetical protein